MPNSIEPLPFCFNFRQLIWLRWIDYNYILMHVPCTHNTRCEYAVQSINKSVCRSAIYNGMAFDIICGSIVMKTLISKLLCAHARSNWENRHHNYRNVAATASKIAFWNEWTAEWTAEKIDFWNKTAGKSTSAPAFKHHTKLRNKYVTIIIVL